MAALTRLPALRNSGAHQLGRAHHACLGSVIPRLLRGYFCTSWPPMSFRRLILISTLALAWCWGAWHDELEGAGFMFDHEHHQPAHHKETESGHSHSVPLAGDDHRDVWARDQFKDGRSGVVVQILLAAFALWFCSFLFLAQRPRLRTKSSRYRRRPPDPVSPWHFVRRCAADAVAPPALS